MRGEFVCEAIEVESHISFVLKTAGINGKLSKVSPSQFLARAILLLFEMLHDSWLASCGTISDFASSEEMATSMPVLQVC